MKALFLFLFFVPFTGMAQDCAFNRTKDDFTNEVKVSTGFVALNQGKSKILLSMDATAKEVDFFFSIANGAEGWCFDNTSTAIVQFAGTRLKGTYRNSGTMNCQGLYHFTFRNVATTPSALNRFATLAVESILFKTGSKQYEILIDETSREKLKVMADCIIKESKTLLPG